MSHLVRPAATLAVFELRRIARTRATTAAAILFAGALAVGHWLSWQSSTAPPESDRFFGYGYVFAMLLTLRLGLATDRELMFDEYLVVNFVTPAQYVAGKVAALAVFLLAFGVYTFGVALTLSAGAFRYAAWYALLFTLTAWLFTPAVLLVELVVNTRVPTVVVVLAYLFTGALLVGLGHSPEPMLDLLGLNVDTFAFGSLRPLIARSLIFVPVALVLSYPLCRLRLQGAGRH